MDVQCERCKTEYEFDDALVSGRGTTVRCTNCGYQFKVRRTEAAVPGNEPPTDRWVVHTTGGNELTFLTLRELQRAILVHQVGRSDMLVRGASQPRTLGSIAELEPFFEGRTSSRPPPPGQGSRAASMPDASLKRTAAWGTVPPDAPPPPVRPKIDTLRPSLEGSAAPPPPAVALAPTLSAASFNPAPAAVAVAPSLPMAPAPAAPPPTAAPAVMHTPPQQRYASRTPSDAYAATFQGPGSVAYAQTLQHPGPAASPMTSPVAASVSPLAQSISSSSPLPPPTGVRRSMPSYDPTPEGPSVFPSDEPYSMPRRRRVGGWIVALVLLCAVGLVGWIVAKPYLAGRQEVKVAQLDPRAQTFLTDGEKAMADGNLDLAQEDFDKASALAERDPRVLLDAARVAAAKADVPWLKLRLLGADGGEEARMTKSQLDERLVRVRKASEDALAVAPEDPAAFRARIDALRLTGDRDLARSLVAKVIAQASQPETAYVLAALDLSEPEPLWGTVIDRLRPAAAAEGSAGRARAALVFALVRSGDATGAKTELAKLDAQLRPYPLLPNLHHLVDKAPPAATVGADAGVPHIDVSALPQQAQPPTVGGGGAAVAANDPTAVDVQGGMGAAATAIKKGDWAKARQIYEGLVARNPNDSEALAGLGDVDRAQGDLSGAIASYKRALGVNPSYLPALLGVADTEWASGNKAAAQRDYKDIADRFPEGTYPPYVKTRGEAPPPAAAASAAAPKPASSGNE
jgi:predicted Zn finger-like uncharacterized protein